MKRLYDALREIVESFDRLGLDYAIMGGIAVRVHGVARPTQDLDLMVALGREDVSALFDSVEELGYTVPDSYRAGWVDRVAGMPLVKFRRYLVEHSLDVDVFLVDSAFQEQMLRRARVVQLDDFDARVISPEDLILLKLVAGRYRDLGDVMDILFMQGQLDEAYMRNWAKELGVLEKLEQLLRELREMRGL